MRPRFKVKLCVLWGLSCGALLAGCASEYVGEDPPTGEMHFPIGIAVDPVNRAALVASSNFDLAYNRGVVHAIDLARVDALIAAGGGRAAAPIEDALRGGALVPSFAGEIALDAANRHAFVPDRLASTLVELELTGGGDGLSVHCGDATARAPDCTDGDHVLQLTGSDAYSALLVPAGNGARIFVGSLSTGVVNVVDAFYDRSESSRLTLPLIIDTELYRASGLALLGATPTSPEMLLVAGQFKPGTGDARPAGAYLRTYAMMLGVDQTLGTIPLVVADQALDARALVLASDHRTAYVVQRGPDSIAALDLSAGLTGQPLFRATVVRSIGRIPTAIALDPGAVGGEQLLVACFADDAIYALDGVTLDVQAVVNDVGRGPANIAVDAAGGRAYVTLFNDDTVAVLALDRADHHGLEQIATIGKARPKPQKSFSLDPWTLIP